LEGESLKLLEFDCDAPAGAAYTDQIEKLFLSESFIKPFSEEHHLVPSEPVQAILTSLLEVYEDFGGYETPQIALVDWRHARTHAECEYIKSYFETKGYKATIADPRDLQYKGGKLYHKQFRIHLIYRRVRFDPIPDNLKAHISK